MTTQNDAKFEEELTCQFKTDMRNLLNFDPSTETISKICKISPKYTVFELKKYSEVMLDGTTD